ncbi:hypothetical protein ACIPYQ_39550 [Streptomyces sp. NPDC090045]|uniref:hypothetical protein n=1 Tax=Streptomyces sp. NPDC090045 TaxID=3365927 RepID=UPI00382558FB
MSTSPEAVFADRQEGAAGSEVTEYRAVLPYYENGRSTSVADPARAFDVRRALDCQQQMGRLA